MVSYGLAYGMEAFGLARRLATSVDEANEIMDRYFGGLPRGARLHGATPWPRPGPRLHPHRPRPHPPPARAGSTATTGSARPPSARP